MLCRDIPAKPNPGARPVGPALPSRARAGGARRLGLRARLARPAPGDWIGFVSQNLARGSGSWTPVSKVSAPKYETKPIQASMSDLPALQRLECKERLGKLPPERRLVAAEPVHDLAVEIRQVQKADRDVAR